MNKGNFDKLVEKYEQGNSSLLEEKQLSDSVELLREESQAWFKYRKLNNIEVPDDLQNYIWESIQRKRTVTLRLTIGLLTTAASILLLLGIMLNGGQSYRKKEALLNEAIRMCESSNTSSELTPIYEDNVIVIYASAE